jgi:hypothetical protein
MLPKMSAARHSVAERQYTCVMKFDPSTCAIFQAGRPLPGLTEVSTLPASSTATHSVVDGHETPEIVLSFPSTSEIFQAR